MEYTYKKEEYEILQQEYEILQQEHATLKTEHATLKTEHATLKTQHTTLKTEHATLKKDYSENVIIQSMDEMKQRYDRLMQSTVPKHKYTLVYDKYSRMVKYFSGCSILIGHILKTITKLNRTLYNQDNQDKQDTKHIINKIESELITTRDILEESIQLPFT